MGYVDENLMPNERVIRKADIHWFVFVPGAVVFTVGLMLSGVPELKTTVILVGIVMLISAVIAKLTTELAVTSRRVIAKTGLISRKTIELNLDKVEGLNVSQGIFGRMLDFGTVLITGSGGGKNPIKSIVSPLEFRKKVMEAIEAVRN